MDNRYFMESDLEHGQFDGRNSRFQWRLTAEGCLIVHGCGDLGRKVEYEVNCGDGWDGHYSSSEIAWPWEKFKHLIQKIIIGEGITRICCNAFSGYNKVKEIELPETLKAIESFPFTGTSINRIRIPESVNIISKEAFADTKLPRDGDEFYVDGWLITYTGTNIPKYNVRPGTRGIADNAFDRCTLEELFIPGTVKHIGRSCINGLAKVYLGNGCPYISAATFYSFDRYRWIEKSIEIIRKKNTIPTEYGEDGWSFATFAETEKTHDKARAHKNSDRLLEVLDFLKNGALEEAAAHCSVHVTSKGQPTPEEYLEWRIQSKERDIWNMSNWGLKECEMDTSSQTISVLLAPQKGVMCSVALAVLDRLETFERTVTDEFGTFLIKCQIPKDLQEQDGFLALKELIKDLFPWIEGVFVISSKDVSTYSNCYIPLEEKFVISSLYNKPVKKSKKQKLRFLAQLFGGKK